MRPGLGTKRNGSSALIRHSRAWPLNWMSRWRSVNFSPAAIRICCWTTSTPVISSVTGCSTWIRVFISMK
ncbi:Uncharacterised protein [Bordetella pertussis]|nr:Uncharacterised protein [Bordetella pertussis]CPO27992.1 Uncharacterised protein [Bordetella pertussis]